MKYHWERSIKKKFEKKIEKGKALVEISVGAASLNCQLFSGRQSELRKQNETAKVGLKPRSSDL